LLQVAQVLHRVAVRAGFAQRRLVRTRDVDLLLVHAVLALGAVDAFLRLGVAELDDLDALHVPAHRVEVHDGVEVAVDAGIAWLGQM
jgi:hypothetical protein